MKNTIKVFIGAMIIELIIARILQIDLTKIMLLIVLTHIAVAILATYIYTGKLFNGH